MIVEIVGQGSNGFIWPQENVTAIDDDEDDEDLVDSRNYEITRLGMRHSSPHELESKAKFWPRKLGSRFSTLKTSSSVSSLSDMSRSSSSSTLASDASQLHEGSESEDDDEPAAIIGLSSLTPVSAQSDFLSECTQSLERSFEEGHTVDNAAIELKTLRMASNVTLGRVREVVIPFILKRCQGLSAEALAEMIERWGGLITSLTGENEEAMMDCLFSAQKYMMEITATTPATINELKFFLRILKSFYEEDIVSEEAVFGWYKSKLSRGMGVGADGTSNYFWQGSKGFVTALAEAEDDDSDSE